MDLRTKRTLLAIKNAYFKLKEENPKNKIKVTKLCEVALINKATFYNYFESIDHLMDAIDEDLVDDILLKLHEYSINYNDKDFIFNMNEVLKKETYALRIHLKDRQNIVFFKLISRIKDDYIKKNLSKEELIKTIFIVSGGLTSILYFIFLEKYDSELITTTLHRLINQLN